MNSTRCVCQFILYIFSVQYYPIFTQFHFSFSQTSSKAHGKGSCLLLAHLSKWWHDNNFIARSQVKKPQPGKSTQTDAIPKEIMWFEVARKTFPYMRLLSGSNRYIAVRVTVESTPSPRVENNERERVKTTVWLYVHDSRWKTISINQNGSHPWRSSGRGSSHWTELVRSQTLGSAEIKCKISDGEMVAITYSNLHYCAFHSKAKWSNQQIR